jgi:hypothetical protein
MSEVEELRRYGNAVVRAWERLGQCEDEFAPDYDPPACNEWRESLDAAIVDLNRIINEHAMESADRRAASSDPTQGAERGEVEG